MELCSVNISNEGSFLPAEYIIELSYTHQERLSHTEEQIYPRIEILYFSNPRDTASPENSVPHT